MRHPATASQPQPPTVNRRGGRAEPPPLLALVGLYAEPGRGRSRGWSTRTPWLPTTTSIYLPEAEPLRNLSCPDWANVDRLTMVSGQDQSFTSRYWLERLLASGCCTANHRVKPMAGGTLRRAAAGRDNYSSDALCSFRRGWSALSGLCDRLRGVALPQPAWYRCCV